MVVVYVAILCRHGRIDYRIHVGCGEDSELTILLGER